MLISFRKFEDPRGVFYPTSMSLLVIVEKSTIDFDPPWFPFQLTLDWRLRIDVHSILQRFLRLVAIPHKHDGWRFQVRGNYKPEKAAAALDDARSSKIPSYVGLNAAAKAWLDAGAPLV